MIKHFVKFLSPVKFVSEESELPIDSWNIEVAMSLAHSIVERYGATPYGFYFLTRTRGENDLDSHISDKSPMYFLGGKVETLAEVKARATDDDSILISNMEGNKYTRIITSGNSCSYTAPLSDDDIVLEWTPKKGESKEGKHTPTRI